MLGRVATGRPRLTAVAVRFVVWQGEGQFKKYLELMLLNKNDWGRGRREESSERSHAALGNK